MIVLMLIKFKLKKNMKTAFFRYLAALLMVLLCLQNRYIFMQFFKFFIVIFLFCGVTSYGQKVIKHKVSKGESIYSIARKYDVTEKEIYEANPKLKGAVLGLKTEVKIPNKKYKAEELKVKEPKKEIVSSQFYTSNDSYITHTVIAKETLYSLSKKYGISMETICEINPELKTGNLKIGSKIKLPNSNSSNTATVSAPVEEIPVVAPKVTEVVKMPESTTTNSVIHKVQPKETLYRLSKKYGVSVRELQEMNPGIRSGLPVGYDLIVKKGTEPINTPDPVVAESPREIVEVQPLSMENMTKAEFLIAKASQHIGTRYRSGGTTSAGFDCSGLMISTFREIQMALPRTSREQSNYGVAVDRTQAQKGDLIFFSTNGRGRVNHVGMITEILDDEIKFIHSSIHSGVIISSTKEEYYSRRFIKINRVLAD